jgi:hypothetical protein
MTEIKVGDRLWYATTARYERSEYVTVEGVGRKWLMLSNGRRAKKDTLDVDFGGYSSHASLHASEEAWSKKVATEEAWRAFKTAVSSTYRMPDGVSVADIEAAKALLRMAGG